MQITAKSPENHHRLQMTRSQLGKKKLWRRHMLIYERSVKTDKSERKKMRKKRNSKRKRKVDSVWYMKNFTAWMLLYYCPFLMATLVVCLGNRAVSNSIRAGFSPRVESANVRWLKRLVYLLTILLLPVKRRPSVTSQRGKKIEIVWCSLLGNNRDIYSL